MHLEALIWEILGSELRRDDHTAGPAGRPEDDSRREAAVRLLDATLAALAATGHLLAVAELVLREQRDRLVIPVDQCAGRQAVDASQHTTAGRQRINLTY
jgi:hypothetical protein